MMGGLAGRLGRFAERHLDRASVGLCLQRRRRGDPTARLGIYVASFDSSRWYRTHLDCIRRNTRQPFNYYVMRNCTTPAEAAAFDDLTAYYGFPIVFRPWPAMTPLGHGESLQRMLDRTDDEIIVLCDVDAFPVRPGWDDWVLEALETHEVAGVLGSVPGRRLPLFVHPCFMAFRRDLLASERVDVRHGDGNDPAWKITDALIRRGGFTPENVAGLVPSAVEVPVTADLDFGAFGKRQPTGFGTTYGGMIFHFWFARCIARRESIRDDDGRTVLEPDEVNAVVDDINHRFGPARTHG